MPNNQSAIISSTGTFTLPDTVPSRTSYTFLGWDTTVIADYTEEFSAATGSTASVTTSLTTGNQGMTPSEYVTKIFAYTNNTGRTISSISVEIVYSKQNPRLN